MENWRKYLKEAERPEISRSGRGTFYPPPQLVGNDKRPRPIPPQTPAAAKRTAQRTKEIETPGYFEIQHGPEQRGHGSLTYRANNDVEVAIHTNSGDRTAVLELSEKSLKLTSDQKEDLIEIFEEEDEKEFKKRLKLFLKEIVDKEEDQKNIAALQDLLDSKLSGTEGEEAGEEPTEPTEEA